MAIDRPDKLPETFEELDDLLATAYRLGAEGGKAIQRTNVREFLNREILAAKGNNRRPDPNDPKVQAIREITERLYAAFQDGTL